MSHVMRKPVYAICEQQKRRSAWMRSLISAFVVRCLDRIIPLVSISKISCLYLASVAEQAGWVYPSHKPQRQVFSWRGSILIHSERESTTVKTTKDQYCKIVLHCAISVCYICNSSRMTYVSMFQSELEQFSTRVNKALQALLYCNPAKFPDTISI